MLRVLAPILILAGCARAVAPPPPRYQALPSQIPAASFRPAPNLAALTLACRDQELPQANGLDDDCDGVVDGPSEAAERLRVHVAQVGGSPLELEVAPAPEVPPREVAHAQAQQDTPYTVTRFTLPALGSGTHILTLRHPAPADASRELTVSVAVETPGGVQTYLGRLAPAEETPVGELVIP